MSYFRPFLDATKRRFSVSVDPVIGSIAAMLSDDRRAGNNRRECLPPLRGDETRTRLQRHADVSILEVPTVF
jgi:hypothetical protein